ncbi:DeoR family transcriptional regulator, lactose phosphotransferase system repressor [Spiroplasma litorale]|uniref:Lactose phosphotransferase system repressor n=1 Tax=Spiroplasma litorale TaxID=216942 RepID=A0A0K1W2C9_9MOLU|nr:DeoR/GlpR family DNA-binding transcription regulator [Spiroplasma litorale]AKX34326.1 DeoR family transcriptional regulator, lactose phosphotransferase system repressor [Spiroplasma litorale]
MHKLERKNIILDKVNKNRFIETKDLLIYLEDIGINESTARRDLKELESENKILLSFGAITSKVYDQYEIARTEKAKKNVDKKEQIAIKAVELLEYEDIIYCAPGTTIENFVKLINKKIKLIVTNSFPVFLEAWKNKNVIDVFLIGGIFKEKSQVFFSRDIKKYIEGIKFSKTFFSCISCDKEGNIYDDFAPESNLLKEALKKSQKNILLIDSTKLLDYGINLVCNVSEICHVITDYESKTCIDKLNWNTNIIYGGKNE